MKSLILIITLVGTILLQIFLSKSNNKWFGLILPIINIVFSIMAVLGSAVYAGGEIAEIAMRSFMIFLVCNIPTIILIAIYLSCREKFKKKKELDKMNIHDLH